MVRKSQIQSGYVFGDRNDFAREELGSYHPSSYFRAVNIPYTKADIDRIDKQIRTGRPAYRQKDYDEAKTWQEKEHMLEIVTTPYHEAFHYFQSQVTSYCIHEQYARAMRDSHFLNILMENDGLQNMSLTDFVFDNQDKLTDTFLSIQEMIFWGIASGTRLYSVLPAEQPSQRSAGVELFP